MSWIDRFRSPLRRAIRHAGPARVEEIAAALNVLSPAEKQEIVRLALALGIVPQERVVPLCRKVESDASLVALTFSPVPYFMRGMFKGDDNAKLFVYKWLDKFFLPMLEAGATSFWETPIGATDFGDARSCCHGWSSAHVGFYGQYILGVTPLEPGFRHFAVRPWAGVCDRAEGEVPTPHGMIRVKWEKQADGRLAIDVKAPDGCEAVIGRAPAV